jgi:uncharacterized protein (TIGR01777 family)
MKLLVSGGTGFIGSALCRAFSQQGHELMVLTRRPDRQPAQPGVTFVPWESGGWSQQLGGCEGMVNLAGESLMGTRWSPEQKRRIRDSRVQLTERLVATLGTLSKRPSVLINASAIGYYGPRGDEKLTEADPPGRDFLAEVCRAWEDAADRATAHGVRVVRLRIGVVLGADGGALAKMVPPFRLFLGGPIGSGRQWMSWIHRDDLIGLTGWALTNSAVRGPINATAPTPVTMREFARRVGQVLHRPSWAPVPGAVVKLLLGEVAEVLLTGQRVMPEAALRLGYRFQYRDLTAALEACLGPGRRG